MIYLKDTETLKIFEFNNEKEAEIFNEDYLYPSNLILIKVWYCDGSGFNGIRSGYSFGTSKEDIKIIFQYKKYSNNEMEYEAVIKAMKSCDFYDHIRSDSQLIINQINGLWKCESIHLKNLCEKAQTLKKGKNLTIEWIPRSMNIAGIELDKIK